MIRSFAFTTQGKLHSGSLIALSSASNYPTTEQTLSALSLLLNGGGIGQVRVEAIVGAADIRRFDWDQRAALPHARRRHAFHERLGVDTGRL